MEPTTSQSSGPLVDAATTWGLSQASRHLGALEALIALWPPAQGLVNGPLAALGICRELEAMGLGLDLAQLLALGPEPAPSRPTKPLRWAVGVTLALRRMEQAAQQGPLTPSLVGEILGNIDAPSLSRSPRQGAGQAPAEPVAGAAVWTLAPRWLQSGVAPLWAAGLALASWEREGPRHAHRLLVGRVLLCGLAPSLGLPPAVFYGLGPYMEQAAAQMELQWLQVSAAVRKKGNWRDFLRVFFSALELSCAQATRLILTAKELHQSHGDVVATWVRAPRHPQALLTLLLARPVLDLPTVASDLDVTQRTAGFLVAKLQEMGVLVEITGQKRGRRFAYAPLLAILEGQEETGAPADQA